MKTKTILIITMMILAQHYIGSIQSQLYAAWVNLTTILLQTLQWTSQEEGQKGWHRLSS